jgi:hypothetical protein
LISVSSSVGRWLLAEGIGERPSVNGHQRYHLVPPAFDGVRSSLPDFNAGIVGAAGVDGCSTAGTSPSGAAERI